MPIGLTIHEHAVHFTFSVVYTASTYPESRHHSHLNASGSSIPSSSTISSSSDGKSLIRHFCKEFIVLCSADRPDRISYSVEEWKANLDRSSLLLPNPCNVDLP